MEEEVDGFKKFLISSSHFTETEAQIGVGTRGRRKRGNEVRERTTSENERVRKRGKDGFWKSNLCVLVTLS